MFFDKFCLRHTKRKRRIFHKKFYWFKWSGTLVRNSVFTIETIKVEKYLKTTSWCSTSMFVITTISVLYTIYPYRWYFVCYLKMFFVVNLWLGLGKIYSSNWNLPPVIERFFHFAKTSIAHKFQIWIWKFYFYLWAIWCQKYTQKRIN